MELPSAYEYPADLRDSHPELYRRVYGLEEAFNMPISIERVE